MEKQTEVRKSRSVLDRSLSCVCVCVCICGGLSVGMGSEE